MHLPFLNNFICVNRNNRRNESFRSVIVTQDGDRRIKKIDMTKRFLILLFQAFLLFGNIELFAQTKPAAPKTKEQILTWLCKKIEEDGGGINLTGNKKYFGKDSVAVLSCSYVQGNIILNYELTTENNNLYDSVNNKVEERSTTGYPYLFWVIKKHLTITIPISQLKVINVHKKEMNSFYDYDYVSFETKNLSIRSKRNSFKFIRGSAIKEWANIIESFIQEGLKDPKTVEEVKYKKFSIHMNFSDNPELPQRLQNAINDLKKYMVTEKELY
jgi:hypothetical protein